MLPLLMAALLGTTVPAAHEQGTASCQATVFVLQDLEKEPRVESPSGRYRVQLGVRSEDDDHGWLRVYSGRSEIGTFDLKDLSGGIFVRWALDSRAFYVMWSNGGMLGGYQVRVFSVSPDSVREAPTTKPAWSEFVRRHPCPTRGANAFAIRWVEGSKRLLLGLQVYPTSDCGREMGRYRGYLVDVLTGRIVARYSEAGLRARWPEGCPSGIYPTGLWGSEDLEQAKKERAKRR